MSIAGGYDKAIEAGARYRCDAIQLFTKNNNQWAAKPITDGELLAFRTAAERLRVRLGRLELAAHDAYLINLASPDPALRRRSRLAFLEEIRRCDLLGIPRLVVHPGAHMGSGETRGIGNVARSLNWVMKRARGAAPRILLETTAGQGTNIGWKFEHLARIMNLVDDGDRLGVCYDTCHVLTAGYDYRGEAGYRGVMAEFDAVIGLHRLEMFHLNDSKRDAGSRVDRHQHIGKGFVGAWAFARILKDPRFRRTPMVLETPKADDMDRKNLAYLRRIGRRKRLPMARYPESSSARTH
jgi:deoxyribonuclease-4